MAADLEAEFRTKMNRRFALAVTSGTAALEGVTALRKTYFRITTYVNLRADEDTRIAEHQGMRQEVTLLGTFCEGVSSGVGVGQVGRKG